MRAVLRILDHRDDMLYHDLSTRCLQMFSLVHSSMSTVSAELDRVKIGFLTALLPNGILAQNWYFPLGTRTTAVLLQRYIDAYPDNDSAG